MAASVELRGVGKQVGGKPILRNVSLEIAQGEFLTLVGPSGCGKSTLLRVVAGLADHDQGSVLINGADVSSAPARDRGVAMVFQSYALYPHMTVAENIATPLRMQRLPAGARLPLVGRFWPGSGRIRQGIQADVARAAEQVQLGHLLDARPAGLSGGQRQRVAVARAMVRHPGVFLMDEPLSNLDARLRVHMRAEIADLHRRLGSTFIYVTHDQTEAMTLSTRVALMLDGEIVQVGTPRELFETPDDIRVARFIGSPEMNLLPVRVEHQRLLLDGRALPVSVQAPDGAATLGIRPERLRLARTQRPAHAQGLELDMKPSRVEVLGRDALLHGSLAGDDATPLVMRADVDEIDALRARGGLERPLRVEAEFAGLVVFGADGRRVASDRLVPRALIVEPVAEFA